MSLSQPYDFLIQWHLTEKCNLRCRHCYQEGRNLEELPLAAIYRVIDEISDMLAAWQTDYDLEFSPSFNVTGGEPFLRPDCFDILEKMTQTGFEIYILSNGTCISLDIAEGIADLGIQGVQVSLDGPKEIHERLRGRGSFDAALQGVRRLIEAGGAGRPGQQLGSRQSGFFSPGTVGSGSGFVE